MRGRRLLLIAAAAAGCGGATPGSGATAWLRASGGQLVAGELAAESGVSGPTVDGISSRNTLVFPGAQGRTLGGSISGTATGVLIGLSGDSAHWILPAGVEDTQTAGDFTFGTQLSFSPEIPLGDRPLVLRAVDASGQVGPAQVLPLKVQPLVPAGTLVVTLAWDSESDLDLHVTVPNPDGAPFDVWSKAPLALQPPADAPLTPDQVKAAGLLDFDSNSQCLIDGRRQENLVFAQPPPAGTYEVRVDAFSMCGQPTARWQALAVTDGDVDHPVGQAFGQASDLDTRGKHAAGAGRLAFTFSIP